MQRGKTREAVAAILMISALGIGAPLWGQAAVDGTATASPGGLDLTLFASSSTILADTQDLANEAFIALNNKNAIIASPGDGGLLLLVDEDGDLIEYAIYNSSIQWLDNGSTARKAIVNNNDTNLELTTYGEFINFYVDRNGNTAQSDVMRVYNNGWELGDRLLQLDISGNLEIDGSLTPNVAFDLAEAFLASEPLSPGEVVSVDLLRPDAVRRSTGATDRTVLGVVSSRPGIVLGGGAFSIERLEENWGIDVVHRFRAEQGQLEAEAMSAREDLRRLEMEVASFSSFAAGARGAAQAEPIKSEDMERLQADYADRLVRLDEEKEAAALDLFFSKNFVNVALAGRVPVRVDVAHGSISPGDYLAPGPQAGTVAKALSAGPVLGIALESHFGDADEIMMLVSRGWIGSPDATPAHASRTEIDRLRTSNATLERRLSELETVIQRMTAGPRLTSVAAPGLHDSSWRKD